jgi:hypothetical protein
MGLTALTVLNGVSAYKGVQVARVNQPRALDKGIKPLPDAEGIAGWMEGLGLLGMAWRQSGWQELRRWPRGWRQCQEARADW